MAGEETAERPRRNLTQSAAASPYGCIHRHGSGRVWHETQNHERRTRQHPAASSDAAWMWGMKPSLHETPLGNAFNRTSPRLHIPSRPGQRLDGAGRNRENPTAAPPSSLYPDREGSKEPQRTSRPHVSKGEGSRTRRGERAEAGNSPVMRHEPLPFSHRSNLALLQWCTVREDDIVC